MYDGSDGSKDRPGHWYEAQLIHYGLPPSKTKSTAKMRLLDALNKGNVAVPCAHSQSGGRLEEGMDQARSRSEASDQEVGAGCGHRLKGIRQAQGR